MEVLSQRTLAFRHGSQAGRRPLRRRSGCGVDILEAGVGSLFLSGIAHSIGVEYI